MAAIFLTLMSLGIGTWAAGFDAATACAPMRSCPMASAAASHCAPKTAISGDCCVLEPQPAQAVSVSLLQAPVPVRMAIATVETASEEFAGRTVREPARVASRLRDIGRQSLFQIYLS